MAPLTRSYLSKDLNAVNNLFHLNFTIPSVRVCRVVGEEAEWITVLVRTFLSNHSPTHEFVCYRETCVGAELKSCQDGPDIAYGSKHFS